MSQSETWRIPQGGQACSACEAVLAPGDVVTTRIRLLPAAPERHDLCAACDASWASGSPRPGADGGDPVENPPGAAAQAPSPPADAPAAGDDEFFWRRALPADAAPRPVVDYAMLRELFQRLVARPEEGYRRLAYLVGLVLIRKRFLRLVGFESRRGREVMVVTRGAGQPALEVPAPYLEAADLLVLREQLTKLLHAELPEGDLPELPSAGESASAESAASGTAGPEAAGGPEAAEAAGDGRGLSPPGELAAG